MEDQKILLQKIVEGIQEKKGKKIITAEKGEKYREKRR